MPITFQNIHRTPIIPHAIVVLPDSDGTELLLCYNDEGIYVNTYSEVTKDVMMQWGELPASVAFIRSGQVVIVFDQPLFIMINLGYGMGREGN